MRHQCVIGKELSDKLSDSLIRLSVTGQAGTARLFVNQSIDEQYAAVSQSREALLQHRDNCRLCSTEINVPAKR